MKSNKKKIMIFFLGVWIIFSLGINKYSLFVHIDYDSTSGTFVEIKQPSLNAVYDKSYIHIRNNWSAAVLEDWCSGDGSFSNPYTIENVIINATNSPINSGILIEYNLNDYFKIKNCTVFTSDGSDNYGIFLFQSDNGTLIENDFSNCLDGIRLTISDNCTISENTANNNYFGINITASKDTTITGNTINDNDAYGIYLLGCNNSIISENSMKQNYKNATSDTFSAIYLGFCNDTIILGNLVKDNYGTGIVNIECNNTIISDNTLERNKGGIFLSSFGISPFDPNYDITVIGNTIEYNENGIWMGYTYNGEIKNNFINFNFGYGVQIYESKHLTILNNSISSNSLEGYAIVGLSISFSDYCEISMNSVSNNTAAGIFLDYCVNLTVSNNIVDLNYDGIKLIKSIWNNISDNTVRNSNLTGIELVDSNYNQVTGNSLSGNGVCIKETGTSEGNIIENNDCGGRGGQPHSTIPGLNLYLILGLIGIISIILMRRRCRN